MLSLVNSVHDVFVRIDYSNNLTIVYERMVTPKKNELMVTLINVLELEAFILSVANSILNVMVLL
jgi:hypothetical protein